MSLNAGQARPGCGCGGSGGCGCGSAAAAADLAATVYVRPRFFAGQLLTEDDLGLLTAYTAAKDRLHNRYLFGAGVVCGLWVTCDPCGGGTVTVQPGYALDCCGNDLVLACPATLDVNAMVRDLRAAQLGKDCGDPCADQGTQPGGRQGTAVTRHYCLYARYGEQDTDLVAPYATGEPCGQIACEPTRIREGISFVLKCPRDTAPPDDLWCRLQACLPTEEIIRRVTRLNAYSGQMTAAAGTAEHRPAFGPEDADELTKHRAGLAEAWKESGQVRSATEHVRKLAAALARHDLAKDRTEYVDISDARSELRDAAAALVGGDAAAAHDPVDRPAVDALLSQAARLADPSSTLPDTELAMLAQGRPLDDSLLGGLTSDAAAVHRWLLARLDSDPALADCELRLRVQAMSVTSSISEEASTLRSLARAGSELVELFARTVTDCICVALNPPCASCEDTDVLLACLEVRDCEVVRICNAARDYVLSGSALRYWLPTGLLHQGVEFLCCRAEHGRDIVKAESGRLTFAEPGFEAGEPEAAVLWDLLGLSEPVDLLQNAMQRVGAAGADPVVLRPPPAPPAASGAGAEAMAQQITALASRIIELTEQLTEIQAELGQTQANLGETQVNLSQPQANSRETQANLSAPGGGSSAKTSQATTSQANTRRRSSAAKRPGDAGKPAAGSRSGGQQTGSATGAADAHETADAGASPADSGAAAAGPDAPEASDGT
jgi:hypothetical protein